MAISYKRLFKLMIDRDIKKKDLKQSTGLSYTTISKLEKGENVTADVLDKIFVPFFTTKPTGSGIGLSLCKQIMNLHGGSISVSSEIGKGSCFSLKFLCK